MSLSKIEQYLRDLEAIKNYDKVKEEGVLTYVGLLMST